MNLADASVNWGLNCRCRIRQPPADAQSATKPLVANNSRQRYLIGMPVEKWSETVVVAHLADDPQFSEDILSIEEVINTDPRDAVLDLAAVHFLNSSNLARLLKVRKQLNNAKRRLILCSVASPVWSAFMVTGLDKVFQFTANVPTALATLQMTGSPD